jgi:hypothetical protein
MCRQQKRQRRPMKVILTGTYSLTPDWRHC